MSQQIIIVDENDSEIGSADRDTVVPGDRRIFRATGLWVTNSSNTILLAQRSHLKKAEPGKWGPAASGTLETGETYVSNLIKETSEELGLTLTQDMLIAGPKLFSDVGYSLFAQWYFLVLDKPIDEFVLQHEEVERVKWFTRNELENEITKNPNQFLHWIPIMLKFTSEHPALLTIH